MSILELLLRWLIARLLPQNADGTPVFVLAEAFGLGQRPTFVVCSALRRDARWAKFNRPPNHGLPPR